MTHWNLLALRLAYKIAAALLAAVSCAAAVLSSTATNDSTSDASLTAALCPIVYRLDESPSSHGYHYTFFGNAFFINEQGDLLTSAHVLETFRDGGQPRIIVSRPNSPAQLLPVTVVAADSAHDVAILHVTPNPFSRHFRVGFLTLGTEPAVPGQAVLAISLHPARLQDAQSFQSPVEDRSPGEILSFESTKLDKSSPRRRFFS
jgi:S1-C subfamily serine protease